MLWDRFKKPQSFLGVDLGAGGMKVVELKREKNHPVLFTYGFTQQVKLPAITATSIPENNLLQKVQSNDVKKDSAAEALDTVKVSSYAQILRELCSQAKTVSKVAVGSLPVSSVFHAVLTLPLAKRDELTHLVEAEVKKLLPLPLEAMVLDVQTIATESTQKVQHVLVNAVPRTLVSFYTAVFSEAGLTLDSLEPESMAVARSLVGKDPATTMIVDIGHERTNFFIIANLVPVTHHSTELGGAKINRLLATIWGIEPDLVEQMKYDLFNHMLLSNNSQAFLSREVFVDKLRSIIDPIIKEIEFSMQIYLRQSATESKHIDKIILTGGAAIMPYLTDYIGDKFKIKCYIGDPWGRVLYPDSLKSLVRSFGPRMAVAIGLALRNVV